MSSFDTQKWWESTLEYYI